MFLDFILVLQTAIYFLSGSGAIQLFGGLQRCVARFFSSESVRVDGNHFAVCQLRFPGFQRENEGERECEEEISYSESTGCNTRVTSEKLFPQTNKNKNHKENQKVLHLLKSSF